MCLIAKDDKLVKADHDIHVYKCLSLRLRYTGKSYEYNTLPLYVPLSEEQGTGKDAFRASGEPNIKKMPDNRFKVSEGFIHTYKSLDDAISHIEMYCGTAANFPAIFEAVIPAGTEYIEGEQAFWSVNANKEGYFDCSKKVRSYASKRIVIGKMVKCRVQNKTYNNRSEYKETASDKRLNESAREQFT